METSLQFQVDKLDSKIKHYLITTMGKLNEHANDEEFYRAFSYALREEVMINWLATEQTRTSKNLRTLYFLSMEYLPGRIFTNNINNLDAKELVMHVMQRMGRNLRNIMEHDADPGLGNGGLGRLASCLLDSLATQHYPVRAYGLRYQYGIFEQQIINGEQVEAPDLWLLNEYPWESRRDLRKVEVKYGGRTVQERNIHGDEIFQLRDFDEVWALPYDVPIVGYNDGSSPFSVVTLRLWTTKESPRNFRLQRYNAGRLDEAAENTTLTDVLYPSDYHDAGKRTRVKQEYLLVSASLQDIIRNYLTNHQNFREFPEKVVIQINDTHPALVIPELIRILIQDYDLPWGRAVEITRECVGYTNHTIMKEALEEWDENLIRYLLPRQLKVIERLNQEFCDTVRNKTGGDEEKVRDVSIIESGRVKMANLAIVGSHSINGVAELHSDILKKRVFHDFYEIYPEKFNNVTNGVTQRKWLLHCNPELSEMITRLVGDGWITDFSQIEKLKEHAESEEVQREFLNIKLRCKERLEGYIEKQVDHSRIKYPIISADSLFDIQIKRVHEYKRQLMNALHILMIYNEIKENPDCGRVPRTFFFGGKAAASYEIAKCIIRLIYAIARKVNNDPDINGLIKVVFVENYSVSKAGLMIPAADLSEQISTAGMEASGTGNMKLTMNGALTIGTHDGANIEMEEHIGSEWWPFQFGATAAENQTMFQEKTYNAWEIASNNQEIQKVVDMLRDQSLAINDDEHESFVAVYNKLFEAEYDHIADRYFVLNDLKAYYETQLKVEKLYKQPMEWAKYCLMNIAGMSYFSTDRSIQDYADKISMIQPYPLDPSIYKRVHHDYSEHDKCRVY